MLHYYSIGGMGTVPPIERGIEARPAPLFYHTPPPPTAFEQIYNDYTEQMKKGFHQLIEKELRAHYSPKLFPRVSVSLIYPS